MKAEKKSTKEKELGIKVIYVDSARAKYRPTIRRTVHTVNTRRISSDPLLILAMSRLVVSLAPYSMSTPLVSRHILAAGNRKPWRTLVQAGSN